MADVLVGTCTRWPPDGRPAVVVQRRDRRHPTLAREPGQIERQVEQVVDVEDVGCGRLEHVLELGVDPGGRIRVFETRKLPVVDDLDDREPLVGAPPDGSVRGGRIVLGRHDEYVVPSRELPRQLEGVDLRAFARKISVMDILYSVDSYILVPNSEMRHLLCVCKCGEML